MMIRQGDSVGPVVLLGIDMRAPREKIWKAWTDPELLEKWFFADEGFRTTRTEVDLRAFGPWLISMVPPSGSPELVAKGHFVEIDPGRRLVYTWLAVMTDPYWTLVTADFVDRDGGSRLELTHGVFANDKDRAAHEAGWLGCLTQLGKLLGEPNEAEHG